MYSKDREIQTYIVKKASKFLKCLFFTFKTVLISPQVAYSKNILNLFIGCSVENNEWISHSTTLYIPY